MTRSKPRIAIILTSHDRAGDQPSGSWYEELAAPYYAMIDAGIDVVLASIAGGEAPIDPSSREEQWLSDDTRRFDQDAIARVRLKNTQSIAALDPREFDGVFLCGGLAVMWDFPDHQPLIDFISAVHGQQGIVSSVCHGAAGLLNVKTADGTALVGNRQIVSWTDEEERALGLDAVVPFLLETALRERGARFSGGDAFSNTVRIDGNIITGQNPASARATGDALVHVITARVAAE